MEFFFLEIIIQKKMRKLEGEFWVIYKKQGGSLVRKKIYFIYFCGPMGFYLVLHYIFFYYLHHLQSHSLLSVFIYLYIMKLYSYMRSF